MKNKYVIMAFALAFMITLFVRSAILKHGAVAAKTEAVFLVGTNAEYPPYTFIEDNTIKGFDIDLVREVAKRLDRPIKFVDMPFDSIIPAALLGRVHLLAAGMTYTAERAKKVHFSRPYLTDDCLQIVSRKENGFVDLNSLSGKKIIVNEGYTADLYVTSITLKDVEIIRLNAPADGFMALNRIPFCSGYV